MMMRCLCNRVMNLLEAALMYTRSSSSSSAVQYLIGYFRLVFGLNSSRFGHGNRDV